ncbi:MAG: hypothetical protein EB068_03790, partial [Betaproteobacteria bacterium]|nr:hypothetical protein [Betaproteobacteria bacterium]
MRLFLLASFLMVLAHAPLYTLFSQRDVQVGVPGQLGAPR